jgi:hypothetical protein
MAQLIITGKKESLMIFLGRNKGRFSSYDLDYKLVDEKTEVENLIFEKNIHLPNQDKQIKKFNKK